MVLCRLSLACTVAVILALAPSAAAQTALVLEGDPFPSEGGAKGLITAIDNLAVNSKGEWIVEVDSDLLDTAVDAALIWNGTIFLREGQDVTAPAGATIGAFDGLTLTDNGDCGLNLYLDNAGGTSTDGVVFLNTALVMQEGFVTRSPMLTPKTRYRGFSGSLLNDFDQFLIVASVDDPAIPSSTDRLLVVITYDREAGSFVEDLIFKEGDLLPGQTEVVADFGTGPHQCAFNNSADVLFFADLAGDPASDGVVCLNSTILAQEGASSPVKDRTYGVLAGHALAMNNMSETAFKAQLAGDAATDSIIIRNGKKFVQEGDVLPAVAPFTLESMGLPDGPLALADNGSLLWYADWSDPDTSRDSGLFVNDQLIVREGVTTINGMTVTAIANGQDAFAMSPNGRYVIFEATLNGSVSGAFLVDLGAPSCRADWNGDRVGNSQDLFDFIADFFGNNADFNSDGMTNSQDFFDFLAAFFAGC